jgi:hypothetical protein
MPSSGDAGIRRADTDGTAPKPGRLEWHYDPTDLALSGSAWRTTLPDAFCAEAGRRLLLAELEFSEWVLRRVEKVRFDSDRSVYRQSSIELNVREDAPVFVDRDGHRHWLVPLSMMRRRTLVNLDLRDEQDHSIMMPGIRLAQQFDQSILLAAAATSSPSLIAAGSELRGFVRSVVAGGKQQVLDNMRAFEGNGYPPPAYLSELAANPTFSAALYRLRRNFTLYVFLPVPAGRHRLLRMSFDEPTEWEYQISTVREQPGGSHQYEAGRRLPWHDLSDVAAAFGLRPTRVRFQVPAAENAASYHFELAAPAGVQIVEASLLAGRPNDPWRHVSADHVVGHTPTVGLHAVEVPNGSLCRAQVDLGIPTRGWLTAMLVSCWLIFAVLLSVALHRLPSTSGAADEVTNIVVLLVSTSAGVATLVAQREFGGVGARLVAKLRAIGVIATALPILGAGLLIYGNLAAASDPQVGTARWPAFVLSGLSALAAVVISTAWVRSWRAERRQMQHSLWDMTEDTVEPVIADYREAVRKYRFDTAAVGIRSAEGWHERYDWDDAKQLAAIAALRSSAARANRETGAPACAELDTECARHAGCAVRRAGRWRRGPG